MRFRPCIDLHEGRVKQLVGGTLGDDSSRVVTNFESERSAADFAALYRRDELAGGHVIMLGPGNEGAALAALGAFPGGMQAGGGITPESAHAFLDAGASHVIVTSYVFTGGRVDRERLRAMTGAVGRERLVLDLSCRARDGAHYVVTDRWQRFTDVQLNAETLADLAGHCAEFLVHAVDAEGMRGGVDVDLVRLLGEASPIPTTYAGGARSLDDLDRIEELGGGRIDATIGSALDIFGGDLAYENVVRWHRART